MHLFKERRPFRVACLIAAPVVMACAIGLVATVASPAAAGPPNVHGDHAMNPEQQAAAMLANAGFQDVETATAAGYVSTLDSLGCFQNPTAGGMGVHYLDEGLLDATLDITKPEALVYELDVHGNPTLVAHEYIVPDAAWTSNKPPKLFGMELHHHPVLPLWVLHTWLWKDNPTGMFQDWNPAVRQCPPGVKIFGS